MGKIADWWCQYCNSVVTPECVTYDCRHDEQCGGCGGPVQGSGQIVTDNTAVIRALEKRVEELEEALWGAYQNSNVSNNYHTWVAALLGGGDE